MICPIHWSKPRRENENQPPMSDGQFHLVAQAADIPEGAREVVEIEDRLIAIFHQQGQYYAIDDVCTHDGGPLAEGELQGYEIICPRHGARFDIRDGRALCLPATRPTESHEVKIEAGSIYVRLRG